MRLRINLQLERATAIPINHQHLLTGVVYRFLESADADYARFLHGEGYIPEGETGGRRFKLFCFSPLRCRRRDIRGETLWLGPGEAEWLVASPVEKFLREFATGLLNEGALRVGATHLSITGVETLPLPRFEETMRFKCLSPIVAAVAEQEGDKRWTRYLRPKDPAFGERVRQNLLGKHSALHGALPQGDSLTLAFDADYLAEHRGTKKITFKDIEIVGAFCPFTLSGSLELIELGYNAGIGEKNAGGFGMVEVAK